MTVPLITANIPMIISGMQALRICRIQITGISRILTKEKGQFDTNLAENQRQFDANLAENQRQFDTNFAEGQRQFNTSLSAGGSENGFTSQQYWNVTNDLEEIQSEVIEGNDDSYNKANEAAFKRITSTYGAGQMTDDEFVSLIDKYIDKEWLALKDEELTKDIFFTTTDENGKEIVDEEGFEEFKKKLKK